VALASSICAVAAFVFAAPAQGAFQFVTQWNADAQDVAVTSAGTVYAAEPSNNRVEMFDSNGGPLGSFGTQGSGDGEFQANYGIGVDPGGTVVYVADTYNYRIQKFSSNGAYLGKWGSYGTGPGEFDQPTGVAVDSAGNVYVADYINDRIQKFTSGGSFITQWGGVGSGPSNLDRPQDVAVGTDNNVYVADEENHRVQKFDANGTPLARWGSQGTGDGQFNTTLGIATDASNNVYVSDQILDRVQKFSSTGTFLGKVGSAGSGPGEFSSPWGIGVDAAGSMYVGSGNGRIEKFSQTDDGGGGGGGGGGGLRATLTSLFCNRGADPDSPWTCTATVGDADSNGASAPGGTVSFAADRGTFPGGNTCLLQPASEASPTRASCSATFAQQDGLSAKLTADYPGGDGAHDPSSGAFEIQGRGEFLVCGASPLPACPPGEPPPQVCVTIWTPTCAGLPPPDLPIRCVSAWQNCEGFGGRPRGGPIDLSGLPASIKLPAACGGPTSSRQAILGLGTRPSPEICAALGFPVNLAESLGPRLDELIGNREQALAELRKMFEAAFCPPAGTLSTRIPVAGVYGSMANLSGMMDRLGFPQYIGETLGKALDEELKDKTVAIAQNLLAAFQKGLPNLPAGETWTGICGGRFGGFPTFGIGSLSSLTSLNTICDQAGLVPAPTLPQRTSCREVIVIWQAAAATYIDAFQELIHDLGLDKRPGGDRTRLAAGSKKAKFGIPLLTGTTAVEIGDEGKLRLALTKSGRKVLKKLRKKGRRTVKAVVNAQTIPMLGLDTQEIDKRVKLLIAKRAHRGG
jgi:sugar lactone lactonase YvrE